MNEPFILEVIYKNTPHEFAAAFQRYGYMYRIAVSIEEMVFFFEPDEEGNYRVLGAPVGAVVDVGLLRVIAEKLDQLQ